MLVRLLVEVDMFSVFAIIDQQKINNSYLMKCLHNIIAQY